MIYFYHRKKALLIGSLVLIILNCSCSQYNNSSLYLSVNDFVSIQNEKSNETSPKKVPFVALNSNAINAAIPADFDSKYMFFAFPSAITHNSIDNLEQDAALSLSFLGAQEGRTINLAFLYDEDFRSKYKLVKEMKPRNMITGTLNSQNSSGTLTVSLEIDKNVRGFLIYSDGPITIKKAELKKVEYGWQRTATGNWYGFSKNGGKIPNAENNNLTEKVIFDFTGCPSTNKIFKVFLDDDNYGTVDNQNKSELQFGTDTITIRHAPKQKSLTLFPSIFEQATAVVSVTKNEKMISGVILSEDSNKTYTGTAKEIVPVVADPGIIVNWPQNSWRNDGYEVFQWEQFPNILVFDTKDYQTQSKMFKRLAFYLEKTGYTGTLWPDEVIAGQHGYNAHDYQAKDLAAFFAKAELETFPLNERELQLKNILLQNSIIKRNSANQIIAGVGAIASVSREIPSYLRVKLLTHEMLHGLYFTHEEYRKAVAKVFAVTDSQSLMFLLRYWETNPSLGYDTSNMFLVQNEFMAYMTQQAVKAIPNYYVSIANWKSTQKNIPELAEYIKETNASGFVESSSAIQDYLFKTWGFASGRVSLVFLN